MARRGTPSARHASRADGASLTITAARTVYEGPRTGWLTGVEAEPHRERWARAVAGACFAGGHDAALAATQALMRSARYAGASLLERRLFVERFGEVALRRLREHATDRAELVGVRRLFARLRQALALDAPAGV